MRHQAADTRVIWPDESRSPGCTWRIVLLGPEAQSEVLIFIIGGSLARMRISTAELHRRAVQATKTSNANPEAPDVGRMLRRQLLRER